MSKSSSRRYFSTESLLKSFKNFPSNFSAPLKCGFRDLPINGYTSSEICFALRLCWRWNSGFYILKPSTLQKTEAVGPLLDAVLVALLVLVDGRQRQWFCASSEGKPKRSWVSISHGTLPRLPCDLWRSRLGNVRQGLAIFSRALRLARSYLALKCIKNSSQGQISPLRSGHRRTMSWGALSH